MRSGRGNRKRSRVTRFEALRDLLSRYRPVFSEELPRFHGGAVGYFGYDMVRFIENIPDTSPDELKLLGLHLHGNGYRFGVSITLRAR